MTFVITIALIASSLVAIDAFRHKEPVMSGIFWIGSGYFAIALIGEVAG